MLHFIGLAGLLGGLLTQISNKPKKLQPFVLHSAWLMIIAGIAMVGLNQAMHADDATVELLDHVTVSIKSTVIAVILTISCRSRCPNQEKITGVDINLRHLPLIWVASIVGQKEFR